MSIWQYEIAQWLVYTYHLCIYTHAYTNTIMYIFITNRLLDVNILIKSCHITNKQCTITSIYYIVIYVYFVLTRAEI